MSTPTEHPMRYTPVGDYHYHGTSMTGAPVTLAITDDILALSGDERQFMTITLPVNLVLCHAEEYPPGRQPLRIRITEEILAMFESALEGDEGSRIQLRIWLDHQWEHAEAAE